MFINMDVLGPVSQNGFRNNWEGDGFTGCGKTHSLQHILTAAAKATT